MDHFEYRDGVLHAEDIPVNELAEQFGTPLFVYSRATFERHYRVFDEALAPVDHLVCYAVKANSNIGVLNVLARLGAGFDIVSRGELERVLAAGGDASKVVFSGVGKREEEMAFALDIGIRSFNVESEAELERLSAVATAAGKTAPVALRVNPDVDAKTHPYISTGLKENKFGIDMSEAERIFHKAHALPGLEVRGMDCHIGSQLTEIQPFLDALQRLLALLDTLAEDGIHIHHLNIGGGLGIRYQDEQPPQPAEYAQAILPLLQGRQLQILVEPGRAIAGNAGILLTQVEYLKPTPHRNFAIVDAAMTELIRPTLYSAWQNIIPVQQNSTAETKTWDIVGPVCESGDWLGKDRELALNAGDLLAVRSSGAYGFTMSSNYNTRPRAAEIMVDGDKAHIVRKREVSAQLFDLEAVLPE
ncbi:MAG: diaminopimelate decarboxylase [Oceanococcus sp.]